MKNQKQVFFVLASARSGTLFLKGLFQKNITGCACRHEPFFDWGNPTLFGPAIYDAHVGRLDRIRARLTKKRDYIERLHGDIYLESSHAFLKSHHVAALEFFPDMRLIHLVRNPLYVAKSEARRQEYREMFHAPFHFYRGDDGRRHFCWALTGNEEIFQHFDPARLSLFQWYLLQWIEIENRAMQFLDTHHLHDRCFMLHTPHDLNDVEKVRELFTYFQLPTIQPQIVVQGRTNKSIGLKTVITPEDEQQCDELLAQLPDRHLAIFRREPYLNMGWSARLRRGAVAEELPSEEMKSR